MRVSLVLVLLSGVVGCVDLGSTGDACSDPPTVYVDADGDGFGDPASERRTCEVGPSLVDVAGDCDDADASVFPGAAEVCDRVDQDCDGDVDEDAVDASELFMDADRDGFGSALTFETCWPTAFMAAESGDCNDGDASVHPGADEICDGLDQDCDREIDEDAIDQRSWYVDKDADGYGAGEGVLSCDPPAGRTAELGGDCDDAEAATFPGAPEPECSDVDRDCDGIVPDAVSVAGVGTWPTIQQGVNAAPSGATVWVCPGAYPESVVITRDVALQGTTGRADDVEIKAPRGKRALEARAPTALTLRGITFSGGDAAGGNGGNAVVGAPSTLIEHCAFVDGSSYSGGGLSWMGPSRMSADDLVIRDSEFSGNYAEYDGGGLSAASWGPYAVLLEDVTFDQNGAGYEGGGAALSSLDREAADSVTFELVNVEFVDNSAGYSGGGLDVGGWRDQLVSITDSTFTGNYADYEGGGASISGWSPTELTIDGTTFDNNRTNGRSGVALEVGSWSDDIVEILDSTVKNHSCVQGKICYALAMGGWGGTELTMERTGIDSNSGGLSMGGRGTTYSADIVGGSFTRNGIGLSVDGDLSLDSVDLGAGSTDNLEWDLSTPGARGTSYSGVTTLTCASGACK